jgi:uncharacterized protein
MKSIMIAAGVLCLFAVGSIAQDRPERRVIEVSGSAERLVTPDTFTFKITLVERVENRQKVSIEQQEEALRRELGNIGIDGKELTVFDLTSTYVRQRRLRDTLATKDYRLKLREIDRIARLQDIADRLNISKLDLIDTEHSEITQIRRQVKMDAMRAAKDKAEYLLGAIGERAGKAVWINEVSEEVSGGLRPSSFSSNLLSNTVSGLQRGVVTSDSNELSFTPFKIRYVMQAKFEIE